MRLKMKVLAVFVLAVMLPCLTVAQYTRTDLVTNSGAGGTVPDPNLVNGWGLVSTSTSPFWVSDNGTGVSTLYSVNNTNGVAATRVGLVVSIPAVSGGPGTPTGIVAPETPAGVQAFTITGTNPCFVPYPPIGDPTTRPANSERVSARPVSSTATRMFEEPCVRFQASVL